MEFNGLSRFVFLWGCGCMMTEKTLLSNLKAEGAARICPSCGRDFKLRDVVPLNESPEEIEAKRAKLLEAAKAQGLLREQSEARPQAAPKPEHEESGLGKRDLESYLLPEPADKPAEPKQNILDSLAGEQRAQKQKGRLC